MKTIINILAVLALAVSAHATTYSSFFAQIADGGSSNQKWLTTITLINTSTTAEQTITVQLFADDGTPLALDFGSGPKSTLVATLAPLGSISGRSSGASSTITTGWYGAIIRADRWRRNVRVRDQRRATTGSFSTWDGAK